MIELVFTTCLVLSPEQCRERHMTFAENITPMACLMNAQPELAKWSVGYPKWQIKKWKCQSVKFAARDA